MNEPFDSIKQGLEEAVALDMDKVDEAIADLVGALNGCTGIFFSEDNEFCVTVNTNK